ncbi:PcfB family protein [uncultured Holdemanella sp.]|uniref:PcfB family protein n=1 Tax=uncultured Holdemanella sp. TaxID=1763549 RepID=UPI002806537C|nr:PcfB family protein [uncultured Holdemanella sp.]
MNSADTADQMMKMTLEGIEVAAEIGLKAGGTAAKSLAVTLYAILTDNKKIKGRTNLDNMLKSGKELKVFAIHHSDLEKFCTEAKHYGVLYSVLKEKNNTDGIVDIMVRAEDASKISRMVDKFDLATIDTKAIRESVLSQKDIKPMSDEEHDALLSKLMDEKTNPELARMSKDGTPFEPSSKTLKKENKKKAVARKRSIATTDRPSVRKELQEIKKEKLKSAAPKMPVKNKSKKKVR